MTKKAEVQMHISFSTDYIHQLHHI